MNTGIKGYTSHNIADFLVAYKDVFNDKYETKLCGRGVCVGLIRLANNIRPEVNYGSVVSGMMHIENIQDLYRECKGIRNTKAR